MGYDQLLFHGWYVSSFYTDLVLNIFLSPKTSAIFAQCALGYSNSCRMKGVWPVNT